jgi:hypothetical protein
VADQQPAGVGVEVLAVHTEASPNPYAGGCQQTDKGGRGRSAERPAQGLGRCDERGDLVVTVTGRKRLVGGVVDPRALAESTWVAGSVSWRQRGELPHHGSTSTSSTTLSFLAGTAFP